MRETIPVGTQFARLPDEVVLHRGGILHGARMAYETLGTLNASCDNVILIMPGLSPNAHVASHPGDPSPGWWEDMVGPGKAIDTNRWHVVCVNSLGSCKGSTGPASINPRTGEPYCLAFPDLCIEDIADAAAMTMHVLGIARVACVVGASMGAMSALALVARHPQLTRSLVNISGAIHALPFAIAIRGVQREAIQCDPRWNNGQYDETAYPEYGMRAARKLGMITYRSAQEWDSRFGRASSVMPAYTSSLPFSTGFAVERYLDCQAGRFAHAFDPNSYLYLSRSMDWFNLAAAYGCSNEEALAGLRLERALVIGVTTDILFPLHQQQQIADGLRAGGTQVIYLPINTPTGHDAFLVDIHRFGPPVAAFLATLSCHKPTGASMLLLSTN